jgi:hypothetical protein
MGRSWLNAGLAAAMLGALAGCVSPEQLRQQDEAACMSFGFQRGTTPFAECLQRESLARRFEWQSYNAPPPFWYAGPGFYPPPPWAFR